MPINRQPADPADLARQTMTLVADDLTEVRMEVDLVLSPVTAQADPVSLRQALLALLTNTIRHAPGEPVRVLVQPEGDAAVVSLADAAPGPAPGRIGTRIRRLLAS